MTPVKSMRSEKATEYLGTSAGPSIWATRMASVDVAATVAMAIPRKPSPDTRRRRTSLLLTRDGCGQRTRRPNTITTANSMKTSGAAVATQTNQNKPASVHTTRRMPAVRAITPSVLSAATRSTCWSARSTTIGTLSGIAAAVPSHMTIKNRPPVFALALPSAFSMVTHHPEASSETSRSRLARAAPRLSQKALATVGSRTPLKRSPCVAARRFSRAPGIPRWPNATHAVKVVAVTQNP